MMKPGPVRRAFGRWLPGGAGANVPPGVVRRFHEAFYGSVDTTWNNTYWLGARVLKNPLDLWIYQELIFETRPDVILETGTRHGGSALYFATVCDLLGHGKVISIDVERDDARPKHPRITYLLGSSVSAEIAREVEAAIAGRSVMASLDSDHREAHVLAEMRLYGRYVTPGCYMVVEDTNLNGNPVYRKFGPGPREAVERFLKESSAFQVDKRREKFLLTFHPGGFLKKVG